MASAELVAAAAAAVARRRDPGAALAGSAAAIAECSRAMAARFRRGGTLLTTSTGQAATDAAHIAVEFLHPVIVGKRALPAVAVAPHGGDLAAALDLLAAPDDIALAVTHDPADEPVRRALGTARARGLLTVALAGDGEPRPDADHVLVAPSRDPLVVKELHVTTYHVLWELVHVFLDQDAAEPPAEPPADADCTDEVCITCGDVAVPARVVELMAGDLALVEVESGREEVSVALVDAKVGDVVLVHAKEAIGVIP